MNEVRDPNFMPQTPTENVGWMDLGDGEFKCPYCKSEYITGWWNLSQMTTTFPTCPRCNSNMKEGEQK